MVRSLLEGKVSGGKIVRPWLGISVQPVTAEIAESLGLESPKGVLVRSVAAGSPVEKAGLKAGDAILSVSGVEISSEADMRYRVALAKIGGTCEMTIIRKGRRETLTVAMQAPPETPARDMRTLKGKHPLSGVTVANLSPALAMELDLEDMGQTGVVVTAGVAANGMLQPGDTILEVNGEKVISTAQLETLMKKPSRIWQITYKHGGNIMTLTVKN